MSPTRVALLAAFALLPAAAGVAASRPNPCTGRFGLDRSLVTGAPGLELIDVAKGRLSLTSCGTTRAKLKAGKKATRVEGVFKKKCPGVRGKAKLEGKIAAPACDTLVGTFRAKQAGISTSFTASIGGTLGGRLAVPAAALADVDTADPAMQGDNDTRGSAQLIPLIASVGGAAGPTDGVQDSSGYRVSDLYAVTLTGDPLTITLNIANPETADLDLFLVDLDGNSIVPGSTGTANVERLETTTQSGPALIVVATFLAGSTGTTSYVLTTGQTAGATAGVPADAALVPGELIVRLRDTIPLATAGQLASADMGAAWVAGDPRAAGGGLFRLTKADASAGDARRATLDALAALRKRPDVVWAEPNYLRRPTLVPNDEFYGLQWHHSLIALPEAWDTTTGSPQVIVAVIDTGVLSNHPDFDPVRFVPGYDFISDARRARDGDGIDADPFDPGDLAAGGSSSFHGTHVAGTIGAATNNGRGVAGVDWNARLMPLRVLGVQGGSDFDIAQAIRFAAGLPNDSGTVPAQRADIINMSLGGPGFSLAQQEAVQAARAAGVIVVVAAGNENQNAAGFTPAALPEAVCVSAVDLQGRKAPYSNFGSVVDVAAPGGDTSVDRDGNGYVDGVLSTLGDDSGSGIRPILKFYQGTSMAAPHVAGVAALMQAAYMAANGGARMTPDAFDVLLQARALTDFFGPDGFSGFGLINARKAVAAASGAAGSGPPSLVAVPASVNLGADLAEAGVLLRSGGAALTVNAVAVGADSPWLTVTPSAALPAPAPVTLRLAVNRGGLEAGTYTGSVVIDSSAGSVTIPVALEVRAGGAPAGGDVGHVFVLLVDPESQQTVAQGESGAGTGYAIDFGRRVPGGRWGLVAGTDRDNDGIVGDAGEAFGIFPTTDSPALVDVPFGGQLSVELPVLEQVAIVATAFDAGVRRADRAYHRLY